MKLIYFLCIISSTLIVVTKSTNSTNSLLENSKKNYGCPRNFVQIGRRCYFFSKHSATWQDAYYRCRHRKSNIAIIKTANQDKRVRRILSKPMHATKERWIGGRYDWRQMKWIWAASGQPLSYHGFFSTNFTDEQKWHCITMDPNLSYRWNTKLCTEKKPYICHTKTKLIMKRYPDTNNRNSSKILNEIPLPEKRNVSINRPQELRYRNSDVKAISKKRRKNKRIKKLNNKTFWLRRPIYRDTNFSRERRNHMINNRTSSIDSNPSNIQMETIKYEIYKENTPNRSSLYPKPIVEEYTFLKSP